MPSPGEIVLVVDDDSSIRLVCRVNLELEGWTVREAESFAAARSVLAMGDVAVMLLDIHVGGESGLDFLAELRAERPEIPIALLTGSPSDSPIDESLAAAVISKPFRLEELTGTVRKLASLPEADAG